MPKERGHISFVLLNGDIKGTNKSKEKNREKRIQVNFQSLSHIATHSFI